MEPAAEAKRERRGEGEIQGKVEGGRDEKAVEERDREEKRMS